MLFGLLSHAAPPATQPQGLSVSVCANVVGIRFTSSDPHTHKGKQTCTQKPKKKNVSFLSLELQGGSEEIPKQILHYNAKTKGEKKERFLFLCLIVALLCEVSHGKFKLVGNRKQCVSAKFNIECVMSLFN